jgi:two-component system invasion response regulator UvrY
MRVLLVDDDPCIVRSWRRFLRGMSLDLVWATTLPEAKGLLASLDPSTLDAALLDLRLVGGSGLDLLPTLRARFPRTAVALVSGYLDAKTSLAAQKSGVMVMPKPVSADELRELVRLLCCRASARLAVEVVFDNLSEREVEVVQLALSGLDSQAAADAIGVSRRTVHTYWRRIFQKTGLRSQREVVMAVLAAAPDDRQLPAPG